MTPEDIRKHYAADFDNVMRGKYRPANAKYLQALRVKANMTMEDVAKAIGTYKMQISRYESGETRLAEKDREALAKVFNVEPDSFLPGI